MVVFLSGGECLELPSVFRHDWLDDRSGIWPLKPVPLMPTGSVPEELGGRDSRGQQTNPGSLRKLLLQCYVGCIF